MAIIGRFCVNITYNIGLQYGAELIPTPVRAQGIVSLTKFILTSRRTYFNCWPVACFYFSLDRLTSILDTLQLFFHPIS